MTSLVDERLFARARTGRRARATSRSPGRLCSSSSSWCSLPRSRGSDLLGVHLAGPHSWLEGRGATLEGVEAIAWNLRFPRVVMAALVGASLGMSGASMQGLFRNPLAEPYLLGVASGASLGATLALSLAGKLGTAFAIRRSRPADRRARFLCLRSSARSVPSAATLALSRAGPRTSMTSLLLAGVVVGGVLTSSAPT